MKREKETQKEKRNKKPKEIEISLDVVVYRHEKFITNNRKHFPRFISNITSLKIADIQFMK